MKKKAFFLTLLAIIAVFSFVGCGVSVQIAPDLDYNSCEGQIYAPSISAVTVWLENAYDGCIKYFASVDRYYGDYFVDDFPSGIYWVVAADGYGNEVSYGPYEFWNDNFIVDLNLWY